MNNGIPIWLKPSIREFEKALKLYVERNSYEQVDGYSVVEGPMMEVGRAVLKFYGVPNQPLFPDTERTPRVGEVALAVFQRDGRKCLDCGTPDNLSVDHVVPQSLGGRDSMENYQTLCRSCNSRKRDKVVIFIEPDESE